MISSVWIALGSGRFALGPLGHALRLLRCLFSRNQTTLLDSIGTSRKTGWAHADKLFVGPTRIYENRNNLFKIETMIAEIATGLEEAAIGFQNNL